MRQLICRLLGSGDTEIRKNTAFEPVWEITIEDGARKICAITCDHAEAAAIGFGIQAGDQLVVLLWRGIEAERIDAALIGRADELFPSAAYQAAARAIETNRMEMCLAVSVAHLDNFTVSDALGNFIGLFDGIEIGDERHGDPVIAIDARIPRNDRAQLARQASA